ncbi:MAG: preprotein translocase subunit SecG [Bacteroidota bacterium]
MVTVLTILIALDCVLLMGIVLIQNPKGGGLDSTFGGSGGASQVLGAARTTDFIEKLTWGLAIALFVLCLITSLVVGTGSTGGSGGPDTRTNPQSMIIDHTPAKQLTDDVYLFEG